MDSTFVLYLARNTLETILIVSAPLLLTCMTIGIVISLLQAITSIKDMTMTIVPKLLALGAVTIVFGHWMLEMLLRFTTEIFSYIEHIGH